MTTYSYSQLKGLWLNGSQGTAYHTNAWASLMAAIAEAESGGNTNALNPNDNNGTQSSFGLWQISTGTHAPPSSNWADPAEQVRLAIGKLNSQGLTAWGTYDSGAYKAYLSNKTAAATSIPGNPTAQSAELSASAAADCLMANPFGVTLPLVGRIGGSGCLFTYSNARAFVGAGLMITGALVMIPGLALILVTAGAPAGRRVAQAAAPAARVASRFGAAAAVA